MAWLGSEVSSGWAGKFMCSYGSVDVDFGSTFCPEAVGLEKFLFFILRRSLVRIVVNQS